MITLTPTSPCPDCGRAIPPAAPEGLCPVCLALAVVEGEGSGSPLVDLPVAGVSGDLRFFGDYELLGEAGRGATGVVYRARQLGVNRIVALKLLLGGPAAGRDFVHRFHTEASTAARLDHPHIVPVIEFGTHDGAHYLVMKFLEGGTLADRLRPGPVDTRTAAELMSRVTRAVHHAHQHGILHRDLKPGNILLDSTDQPYVADFGLARMLEADSNLTLSHAIVGTAAYLAPEIARGGAAQATVASDIYGLGAVLYELLAGHPPFTGTSIADILRKVQEQEPPPPQSKIKNQKSKIADLETICLKCLEKEPAKRYPTAQALADDLDRFLNHEPILARPVTRLERAWRWCRRKPALAASLLLVLVLVLVLGIASPIAAYRINEARSQAVEQAATARTVTAFLRHEVLELADPTLPRGDLEPDRDLTLAQAILVAGERLEGRFDHQPEVEADIRLTIGRTLLRLDRLPEAHGHLSRALALRAETSGERSLAALEVRHELGLLLHQQGRHEEAVASHRLVLDLRRHLLGDDDLAVLQSLNALAASLSSNASNFDEATALYQEVMEKSPRALGEDHALVLEAKSGLSQIAYELGHWDESARLKEELSKFAEREYGANDPTTLRLQAELIHDLRRVPGRFEDAERLREQAIERCRRVLGPDHPTTVFLLVDQGYADQNKGLWGTAIHARREILDLVRARHGERHGLTLSAQDMLGGILRWFGDFKEAEAIHRHSVPIRQALGHQATIAEHRSQRYLVWALFHQGKIEEAEHYQKQVFNGLIEAYGPQMQRVFLSSEKVVKFLGTQGKWPEIANIYRELAPLDTARHSIWPLGLLHLPAGLVAAALAEDEDTLRMICGLMVDRFQAVNDPQTAAEVAVAFLTVEPHLLTVPEIELLRRLLPIVEADMATSTMGRLVGGLARHRFGDAAQAIELLQPLLPNPDSAVASCAGSIVAMAHHRHGNRDEAPRALHEANARLAVALQSGQLDHKGQDDWDYSVRWAEFGRALILQHQAETAILGRRTSPTVDEQFLKARREEWSAKQALLDEFEQSGRQRNWQQAKATLVQVLESGPILWDQHGNRVPDLAHKAAVVLAITGDRERYQRLLAEITLHSLPEQPYYSLPLFAGLEPQTGLAERIAAESRSRYQAVDILDIWERVRWGEAELRSGHPEAALLVLEPALAHHRLEASGIALAYSALAATALQRDEHARQLLEAARSKHKQLLTDNPERLAQDWHQFARLEQLISEAEAGS
ncbi:MAG: protein kinase [Verrucomicrobiales bacterium]|nr:protein kinase [Verrucomicrobiales bacterium]